jgi:hypothetical protein
MMDKRAKTQGIMIFVPLRFFPETNNPLGTLLYHFCVVKKLRVLA